MGYGCAALVCVGPDRRKARCGGFVADRSVRNGCSRSYVKGNSMRILYTGADGYIGAVLGPKLLDRGYDATGIDTGLYRRGWLFDDGRTRPMVISKDIRQLSESDLEGLDAVVHLAE